MAPSESAGKYLYLTTSNGPQINLNSTGGMNVTSGLFVSEGTTISLSNASSKIEVTYRFRTISVSTGADS